MPPLHLKQPLITRSAHRIFPDLFDNLHKELTDCRNEVYEKTANMMALDIIQLIDSIKDLDKIYKEKEYREFTEEPGSAAVGACGSGGGCGAAAGCGSALSGGEADTGAGAGKQPAGCGGPANGCGGSDGAQRKVELIADCRSLVCKKIGFQAQKQLEKRAIAGFDVDCTIDEAITKIAVYFNKIDNHISLRR